MLLIIHSTPRPRIRAPEARTLSVGHRVRAPYCSDSSERVSTQPKLGKGTYCAPRRAGRGQCFGRQNSLGAPGARKWDLYTTRRRAATSSSRGPPTTPPRCWSKRFLHLRLVHTHGLLPCRQESSLEARQVVNSGLHLGQPRVALPLPHESRLTTHCHPQEGGLGLVLLTHAFQKLTHALSQ